MPALLMICGVLRITGRPSETWMVAANLIVGAFLIYVSIFNFYNAIKRDK